METNISLVFSVKDYRVALKQRQMQLKNALGKTYVLSELAKALRVQRSYLSKVFTGNADLSEDQFYLAVKYLKFTEGEVAYLQLLHQYQRSGLIERKRELKTQLEEVKNNFLRADRQLKTRPVNENENQNKNYQIYFLDPIVQLTHMFLTIDKFKKKPKLILEKLNINEEQWRNILEVLIQLELIEVKQDSIIVTNEHIMLSKDSHIFEAYHLINKFNSTQKLQSLSANSKNSMSLLFTCSKETAEQIRIELIGFLKSLENHARQDNNPTDVFQINLDLFPWS